MALETSFILFPREIPQRFAIKQLRLWFCADATSEKKKSQVTFPRLFVWFLALETTVLPIVRPLKRKIIGQSLSKPPSSI